MSGKYFLLALAVGLPPLRSSVGHTPAAEAGDGVGLGAVQDSFRPPVFAPEQPVEGEDELERARR